MPGSTTRFKEDTKNYILSNYPKDSKILDVGPGYGVYADLLHPYGYNNIDCIEVYSPYVKQFGLDKKYRNVFIENILNFDIKNILSIYNLVILGDVLEHIETEQAILLINSLRTMDMIIAVPFGGEQGAVGGNIYETHLQTDLTEEIFNKRYPGFYLLGHKRDYAVYVSKPISDPRWED